VKQSMILYGPSGRGADRYGQPPGQYPPGYYAPVYYPPPGYYYGPPVNPYEAARQGESADRIASLIWKLVLAVVVCVAVGVGVLMIMVV